jgi:hypothetical protein
MKTRHERKILSKIQELNGKYKVCHNLVYDGRRETVALIKIDGKYYSGNAQLSNQDRFDRKIGRAIALGRAYKKFKLGIELPISSINNEYKFREDRVENEKNK